MGCDIHMYVEYETKVDGKDVWVNGDNWRRVDPYQSDKYEVCHIFTRRSYTIFGLLAGVRSKDVYPISTPKGLPKDISKDTLREFEYGEINYHTPSYLTLKELKKCGEEESSWIEDLISDLEIRKRELLHLYYENNEYREYDDKIRIVFWFDC